MNTHLIAVVLTSGAIASALGLGACGGGLATARRADRIAPAHEVSYVQVLSAPATRDYRIVSFAAADHQPADAMADEAEQSVVAAMRAQAALVGADALVVQRYASPWRKAFIGLGLVQAEAGQPDELRSTEPCDAAVVRQGGKMAEKAARRCLTKVQSRRPNARGTVDIRYVIDPWGQVLTAAATPDSSRDGELQGCVLAAVYGSDFGISKSFQCQGQLKIALESP